MKETNYTNSLFKIQKLKHKKVRLSSKSLVTSSGKKLCDQSPRSEVQRRT